MTEVLAIGYVIEDIIDGQGYLGGAATATAVNTVRLGHEATLVALVGDDQTSCQALETFKQEGVNTNLIAKIPGVGLNKYRPDHTNRMSGWEEYGLKPHLEALDLSVTTLPKSEIAVITSSHPQLSREAARKLSARTRLAFVPGPKIRGDFAAFADPEVLHRSDWLVLNQDEGEFVQTQLKTQTPRDILQSGPQVVIITKGDQGAELTTTEHQLQIPAIPVENVVDLTGAGDAFTLGFVLTMNLTHRYETALRAGTLLASKVIQKYGVLLEPENWEQFLETIPSRAPEVSYGIS